MKFVQIFLVFLTMVLMTKKCGCRKVKEKSQKTMIDKLDIIDEVNDDGGIEGSEQNLPIGNTLTMENQKFNIIGTRKADKFNIEKENSLHLKGGEKKYNTHSLTLNSNSFTLDDNKLHLPDIVDKKKEIEFLNFLRSQKKNKNEYIRYSSVTSIKCFKCDEEFRHISESYFNNYGMEKSVMRGIAMYCYWMRYVNCTIYEVEKIKFFPVDTEYGFLKLVEEKEQNLEGTVYISTPNSPCMLCVLETSIFLQRIQKININFYFYDFHSVDLTEKFSNSKIYSQHFFHSKDEDMKIKKFSETNYGKYYYLINGNLKIERTTFSYLN